jgi:acyl-CoA reductase-like NAD-dependent aldehyde dehydrogenase
MEIAVRRILWGKGINAGQTCIAPDYILCTKEVQEKFIETSKKVLKEWFGNNQVDSPDLCRIINDRHFRYYYNINMLISNSRIFIVFLTHV